MIILGLAGAGLGAGIGWYGAHAGAVSQEKVIKQVPFQTYTIQSWPDGYKIDEASIAYDNGAYVFNLGDGNHTIQISQQKMPEASKLEEFMTKYLPRKKQLTGTPFESWVSDFPPGGTILGVKAEETWIVVITTQKNAGELLKAMAEKLEPNHQAGK